MLKTFKHIRTEDKFYIISLKFKISLLIKLNKVKTAVFT